MSITSYQAKEDILKEYKKEKIISTIKLEKELDTDINMICRVSTKGNIKFCNKDFILSSEYFERDLIGNKIDMLLHPEMPEIINLVIQNNLERGKGIISIVKNRTKFGKFFWTFSEFSPNKSDNLKIAYQIESKGISEFAKKEIEKLYSKLYKIEQNLDVVSASKYLIGFLEERGMSFSNYIAQIVGR